MDLIAGVDGCRGGWLAVCEDLESGEIQAEVLATASQLFQREWAGVAIDIPIGLTDNGKRRADTEARKFLSPLRHNSVFPAPIRPALAARTRLQASEITRSIDGRGVGAQAFAIFGKIKAVDDALQNNSAFRKRVFEIHPEVSFAAMNGDRPLPHPKRGTPGVELRKALVAQTFHPMLFGHLRSQVTKKECADDDVLDAIAALWSLRRIMSSKAKSFPSPAETDSTGIRQAIWC